MKCPIDSLDLSLYLDGEMNQIRAGRIRRHLVRCPRCRARYDELAEVDEALAFADPGSDPTPEPPQPSDEGDGTPALGESAAGCMPGRRRLLADERRTKRRRGRNALVAAAVITVAGGVLWWSGDVPVRKDLALFQMGDANRRRGALLLEEASAIEVQLAEIQTMILERDLDPEEQDALERLLVAFEEKVTRIRAAARHASAGALPGAAPIDDHAPLAPVEGATEGHR